MTSIHLTRRAIQDLRGLRSSMDNQLIPEIFLRLQSGELALERLHGNNHISYHKRGTEGGTYLRLFLDQCQWPEVSLVIAAGRRAAGDTEDVFNQDFAALPREPRYLWSGEFADNWDAFINEGYHYAAVVSELQREAVRQTYPVYGGVAQHVGFRSIITQAPPGTGKTLTAAEKASEFCESECNVIFLLPKVLINEQVMQYRCIRRILQQNSARFFIGTFQQWLRSQFPTFCAQVMEPSEELACLQSVAEQSCHWSTRGYAPITDRDVLLYQLFARSDDVTGGVVYTDNQTRIKELRRISCNAWQASLGDRLCRVDLARALKVHLQTSPLQPLTQTHGTVVIIDEAQDYLLDEIECLKQICYHWQQTQGHQASLWLLGDMNQRIAPVDFDWGALHLEGVQEVHWPNFRTTQRILALANAFQARAARMAQDWAARRLQPTTDPADCFEKPGDAVRVLAFSDLRAAEQCLQPLMRYLSEQVSAWEQQYSLQWRLAARARLLCSDDYHVTGSDLHQYLQFIPVSQAKGREFDACIAFCIFDAPAHGGQLEAYTRWYTQLTRARHRLLLVTTADQLAAIGQDLLETAKIQHPKTGEMLSCCEWVDVNDPVAVEDALIWITEIINELQFNETEQRGIEDLILAGVEQSPPLLYWDWYEVVGRFRMERDALLHLEQQMVARLYSRCSAAASHLNSLLQKPELAARLRLRSLLLRSLGYSWAAAEVVQPLQATDPLAYADVIAGIVSDLECRGLPFEAKRLNQIYGEPREQEQHDRPFAALLQRRGNLMVLLDEWVAARLARWQNA